MTRRRPARTQISTSPGPITGWTKALARATRSAALSKRQKKPLQKRLKNPRVLHWARVNPGGKAVEEFLEFVIRQLIEFPDEMVLTRLENPRKVIFKVQLRQSDIGRVIGKHGQTINAIRNLLSAAASRHGQRALL